MRELSRLLLFTAHQQSTFLSKSSASIVQCAWRSRIARRIRARLQAALDEKIRRTGPCIVIQCFIRSVRAGWELARRQGIKRRATVMQCFWRSVTAKAVLRERKWKFSNATRIQGWWRRRLTMCVSLNCSCCRLLRWAKHLTDLLCKLTHPGVGSRSM